MSMTQLKNLHASLINSLTSRDSFEFVIQFVGHNE